MKYSREDELLERLPEIAELFQLLEDATSALDYLRRVWNRPSMFHEVWPNISG